MLTGSVAAVSRAADTLDRFLLPLVLFTAALGVSFPGPGRRADAADAILITLAVLVFCTGASMTFTEMGAIRTAGRLLAVVLAVTTISLPALAWLASRLVSGVALRGRASSSACRARRGRLRCPTGLAGGEAALAAGLLAASTAATVLLAGLILSLSNTSSRATRIAEAEDEPGQQHGRRRGRGQQARGQRGLPAGQAGQRHGRDLGGGDAGRQDAAAQRDAADQVAGQPGERGQGDGVTASTTASRQPAVRRRLSRRTSSRRRWRRPGSRA